MPILSPYFARNSFARLKSHLKDGVIRHAEQLLDLLAQDGKAQVATVLSELFPMAKPASANTQLNRLRSEINKTATAHSIPLELAITQDKRAGANNRWAWFEGGITGSPLAHTGDLNAIARETLIVNQRGMPITCEVVLITFNEYETRGVFTHFSPGGAPPTERRADVDYHLLGAHGGMQVVHCISKQGEGEAQNTVNAAIDAWQPRAVIAVGIAFGMKPEKQNIGDVLVAQAIWGYELSRVNADGTHTPRANKPSASHALFNRFNHLDHTCRASANTAMRWPKLHFGTLVSGNKLVDNLSFRSSLLTSEPEAIGGDMEAVGVQLAADRKKVDWIIVKAICDWGDGNKNTAYKACDQQQAGENAALVVKAAFDLGHLYPAAKRYTSHDTPAPPSAQPKPLSFPRMNLRVSDDVPDPLWVRNTGLPTSLEKDRQDTPRDEAELGVEVMPYLLDWVNASDAPALFALLSEYGMGKTVTSQKLCTLLTQRLTDDATQPVPLYFDLRNVTGLDKRVPTLRETLEECMHRGWETPATAAAYTLENVLLWMDRGAVIIIDGLDEVLVKLNESDGQVFTNTLIKLLSDARQRPTLRGKLRMLLTCRTQYFRTLRDQKNHFTGQERGEYDSTSYRAMVLLPLIEEQVLGYLRGAAPEGIDPERLLDTLRSVHNLEELTQRPYTLKLVAEFIPEIERDRLAGRTVYGVTLYRRMVQRWLERDSGKHHISTEDKMRLAAHLAAHLWRNRSGTMPAKKIQNWFHAWLKEQSDIQPRYTSLHPDQLEEDLRTATFLARQDNDAGDSTFRFAHTSLQEFFLADYLFQAVRDNSPDHWAMPVPSHETLDFLGQMFAEAKDAALLHTLQQWRHDYRAQTSELLLAYVLFAKVRERPVPLLQGINLRGAALRGWRFNKRAGERDYQIWCDKHSTSTVWLDLSGADFTGADLREVHMARVRLTRATFDQARMDGAILLHCPADQASFAEADLTGTIFRNGTFNGSTFTQARGYRTRFLRSRSALPLQEARLEHVLIAPRDVSEFAVKRQPHLSWLTGNAHLALFCAWSGDGTRLLSAGISGALRIWDAHIGEPLLLLGHVGVMACAWSGDGTQLLSAGDDGTLRTWNAHTGELLLLLNGHAGEIRSCAWSGDGTQLLSAGDDGTLRTWNAHTGELLFLLTGHTGAIISCAWSNDNRRLLSAGVDGTLRTWDAHTGEPQLILRGHSGIVCSVSWSGDGTRLLSAGGDSTIRTWNAHTGEPLLVLTGHTDLVLSCAWSSDSTRLLSGGLDRTLRTWDADTGEPLLLLHSDGFGVKSCAWSSDGTRLLSADGELHTWDAHTGEPLLHLGGYGGEIKTCAWSSDGTRLLAAGVDGWLQARDARSGEPLRILTRYTDRVVSCAWSSDGTRLLSADHHGTLRTWDARTHEPLLVLTGHADGSNFCSWSNDNSRLLAAGNDGTLLRTWDALSGDPLLSLSGHDGKIISSAWSGDGTRLLSGGLDGTLRTWDAYTGKSLLILAGHNGAINSCAWSGDGTRLLSAGKDSTLRIWDAHTGEPLFLLSGHVGKLRSCAWSDDGTLLLSAGDDGTLRTWDAYTGKPLLILTGHAGGINSCSWSNDNTRLLSAGDDGTLREWDSKTGALMRMHGISKHGYAVWLPQEDKVVQVFGDAWRWLGWKMPGEDNFMTRLPLETFGMLP